MKKLFGLCLAAAFAVTMTAQDIAVNIKLVAQSGGESTLLLASGTGVSSADNATLVAPLTNSDNVAIYVQDDQRYSIFATDGSFANQPIAFITDRKAASAQTYTLYFEDVLAGTGTGSLKIKDLVTGDEMTITNGSSYGPFTVNTTNCANYAEGTNTAIADRFIINYNATDLYTVKTNAYGWASYSNSVDLAVPASLKAYQGTAIAGDLLSLSAISDIPANTGVFVYGAANTTYFMTSTTASSVVTSNVIKASVSATDPSTLTGTIYVLHDEALYEYTGTDNIPANKAYMLISAPAGAPKRIRMVINDVTAVDNVEAEAVKAEKFVEDGQVYIRRGNEVYNLQGQIVK